MSPIAREPWPRETRDRWFLGLLAASTVAVAYLFSAYLYVLMFASVLVVVTWPLFTRIRRAVGQERRALAAVLTTVLLFFVVFGPLASLVYLFVLEAVAVAQSGVTWVQSGGFEAFVERVARYEETTIYGWIAPYLPADFDPLASVAGPVQSGALSLLNQVGSAVPDIVGTTVGIGLDVVIFLGAVVTLYMEGPRVLRAIMDLSPMDDAYEVRLFRVFAEFANNMVVGSLATGFVQACVASVGYAIAGVDRLVFFGILTGVFSFVPLVGTAIVWVPLAVGVGFTYGLGWGLFLALWNILFTGTVDNVVKPLFLRGSSDIHPLLIFLAVFGGMGWFGLPGVLLGPVMVAGFLALFTIYRRDFLGMEIAEPELGRPRVRRLPRLPWCRP